MLPPPCVTEKAYIDVTKMFPYDSIAKRSCHQLCIMSVLLRSLPPEVPVRMDTHLL